MTEQQTPQERLAAATFEPRQAVIVEKTAKLQPRLVVLALGTLVLAYALFFLLTAKSVAVTSETVTPIDINVGGLALPFGDRLLIRPGTYPLTITAEGYFPFQGTLEVDSADVQNRAVLIFLP